MTKAKWSSLGLSFLVVIILVVWMATGEVKVAGTEAPPQQDIGDGQLTSVQVQTLTARVHEPGLLLQGQLEPWHSVMLSAQVSGRVESLAVDLGESVKAGQTLLTLSDEGRSAAVLRWQARVRKLEADLAAVRRLRAGNLAAQSEILALESELAAANAELTSARLEVSHLQPVAPFAGVINSKAVDAGDLVQIGAPLFQLVRIDRLKAKAQIPQQAVSDVAPGQAVRVDLLDGTRLSGVVTFVASAAAPETRSFAVEIAVENPDLKRVAGGSASLRVALPEVKAIFVSPAYLSLGDDGRPGVKYVDDQNRVVFGEVRLLSVSTDGAWVTGLPDEIRLITRGGGFVSTGEQVVPFDSSEDRG
ncbi:MULTISPECIES: efflux RND transporter periplasmic adaptor subunit [Marinobacter]|uniref:Efflux transporter periplasmic adaptor subunit n=1 Tax=Marinobacter profundi TaxID=2666256 RepID=A0A2G1UGJ1_9GAMM|nr:MULTISPECIES: efflux RND transporter periplasmic adaptor subunit [Marinobacter]MBD3655904.1 efflux RND transporter periplasmic adaptor subunit [Marinobacter sp.]PHQ13604.1 efflux transporter periplasmic adaptor subunit [Marinobacter profundi]